MQNESAIGDSVPSSWSESFGPDAMAIHHMKKTDAAIYADGRGIEQAAVLAPNGNDISREELDDYLVTAENIIEKMRV